MESVIDKLESWGPGTSSSARVTSEQARAYTRRLTATHYENFPVASWLLPRELRQHFCNVYAYCRWADDLGDETGDPRRSLELLSWWRDEVHRCYEDDPQHPVFVALQETIREFAIPAEPFLDLISAFEQDQTVTEYETFSQLRDYCRRSADPVGRIVLHLCGAYRDETVLWSDSICTGLQLANFWQDVARDFEIGRVYLPQEDRRHFGYTHADLHRRVMNDSFRRLMEFEVDRSRELLLAGLPLVEAVPGRPQVDIELFIRGGLQVLRQIERIDYRVWETRPVVSKWRFGMLFAGCLGRALVRPLRGRR